VRPENKQEEGGLRFSLGYTNSVEKKTLFGLSFANLEEWQLIAIFGMISICLCFCICMGVAYRCKNKGAPSPEKPKKDAPKKYAPTQNQNVLVEPDKKKSKCFKWNWKKPQAAPSASQL
jgi:hypothetical protein